MDAVLLHASGCAVDVDEQEGKQRGVVFSCQQSVGFVELANVVGTVVGRKSDAAEYDLCARGGKRGDDLVEVPARGIDRQPAQAVVSAEGDDDHFGIEGQNVFQAVHTVFSRIAADAEVHDFVVVAKLIEVLLQVVGIAFAAIGAVARGEAVSECDDHWPSVVGFEICRFGRWGRG